MCSAGNRAGETRLSPGTALYLGKALVADTNNRQAEEALVTLGGKSGGISCVEGRLQRGREA